MPNEFFNSGCPGCGGRSIDSDGNCRYCKNPLTKRPAEDSKELKSEGICESEIDDVRKEIHFLEEQFRDTGHASIPAKIERAKMKLRKLIAEK